MKNLIAQGKGRIIEELIDINTYKGFVNINGRTNFLEKFDKERNVLFINDSQELLNNNLRLTRYAVEVVSTENKSKYDGTILALKGKQWKYAFKELNKLINIDIVELDNGVVVAKKPTTKEFIKVKKEVNKNRE